MVVVAYDQVDQDVAMILELTRLRRSGIENKTGGGLNERIVRTEGSLKININKNISLIFAKKKCCQ